MSNLSQFTNKQNLKLLWEVLLDELHINTTNTKLIGNIRTVFESNINPFTSRSNPKLSVMDLNKQFLSQVVLAVNRLFPNLKQEQSIKRITISDEEISDSHTLEPYKIEDIHASRQSDFEKEVERKRMELENYMTPQKPRELDFSDRNSDGKIKAMDSLVAEKMAQRNLDIETLQNSQYNMSNVDPEKWLTPKETSVKNEKIGQTMLPLQQKYEQTKLKHISFDNDNNITLTITEPEQKMKKVTWNDLDSQEPIVNIFNKLKKQPIIESIPDNITNNNENNSEKQYIEQKSMPLPEVKKEEIIRNQIPNVKPIPANEPIIPKTEIIKQLNEMNKKIDNLYEIMFKFINEFKTNEIIQNKSIISDTNTEEL